MLKNVELKEKNGTKLEMKFLETEFLYGLPERASDLVLEDTNSFSYYRLFNNDKCRYEYNSYKSLYGNFPVVFSSGSSIKSFLIWNNPSLTFVSINTKRDSQRDLVFLSESGIVDVSFDHPQDTPLLIRVFHI